MARVGTSNFRHPSEHKSWMAWDGFWREGMDREAADHPYHSWNIDSLPDPTYKHIRSASHDTQLRMWNHKANVKGELPYCGKSACHSARFHGHSLMPVTMLTLKHKRDRKEEKDRLRLQYRRAVMAQPDLPSYVHKWIGGDIDTLSSDGSSSTRSGASGSSRRSNSMGYNARPSYMVISARSDEGNRSQPSTGRDSARPPIALAR